MTLREIGVVTFSLVIFLALLFHKVFFDPFVYFTADTAELYFPWWQWTHRMLLQGYFPVFNREWFGGSMPFVALETEVFYPVYWFFNLLMPPSNLHGDYLSYLAYELFHYVLGGVGFYVFCRLVLKLSSYASLFGSIAFIGSGAYMARFVHPGSVFPMAYYPWLLSGFFQYVQTNKWKYFLWSVTSLAMIVLSGHPHVVYFVVLAFGGSVTFLRSFKKGLFVLVIGLLLAAVKILPLLEASIHLVRISDVATSATLFNSVPPLYFLTMLIPTLFGRHQQDLGYWGTEFAFGSWENYVYIGIVPLLLLPFSLSFENIKLKRYLWTFTLLFGVLLLGNHFPPSAFILKHLPFSSNLGVFTKVHLIFHFYVVCLSAVGMQKLIEQKKYPNAYYLIYLLVGLFFAYFVLNPHIYYTLRPVGRGLVSAITFDAIHWSTVINTIFFICAIGMFVLWKRTPYRSFILVGLLMLTIIDLVIHHKDFHPIIDAYPSPKVFYEELQEHDFIVSDKSIFRVVGEKPSNASMVYGFESIGGYHTVYTDSYSNVVQGLVSLDPVILNRANVKYVYSREDLSVKGNFTQLSGQLWENKDVVPRVFYENGDMKIVSYTPRSLNVEVSAREDGNLFLSEFQYPGWKAKVDGAQTSLEPANDAFYAVPLEKGMHTVEFYYQSDSVRFGMIVSLITILFMFYKSIEDRLPRRSRTRSSQ